MIERDIEIVNKLGLHARAAAKLVSCCGAFSADIRLSREGDSFVDGKSIMAVMLLAAAKGTVLKCQFEGPDEVAAADAVGALFAARFDEGE